MEYKITLDPDTISGKNYTTKDIVLWCVHNFGPVSDRWDWTVNIKICLEFKFQDKHDVVQFTLAWC